MKSKRVYGWQLESSYMAESMVLLPVFVTFIVVLLFYFRVLQIQQVVENAMIQTGRELAVTSYAADNVNSVTAFTLLQKNLKGKVSVLENLNRKNIGISLLRLEFEGDYITLVADYQLKLPVLLLGERSIEFTNQIKCRKWTGRGKDSEHQAEEIVYITPNGVAYHKDRGCTYLSPTVKGIAKSAVKTARNEDGGKYYACNKCKASKAKGIVYITDYGTKYHAKRTCSDIQRHVLAVFLSEISGRHACGKCS